MILKIMTVYFNITETTSGKYIMTYDRPFDDQHIHIIFNNIIGFKINKTTDNSWGKEYEIEIQYMDISDVLVKFTLTDLSDDFVEKFKKELNHLMNKIYNKENKREEAISFMDSIRSLTSSYNKDKECKTKNKTDMFIDTIIALMVFGVLLLVFGAFLIIFSEPLYNFFSHSCKVEP